MKYSTKSFPEYKTRVKLEIFYNERLNGKTIPTSTQMDVYTEETDRNEIEIHLDKNKGPKVTDIQVIHWATKAQDDAASKLIEETLKDWN